MALKRGVVVEYPAVFTFEDYPRPYLIASDDSHPYHGEEYVGLAITTTDHDTAVAIEDDDWVHGGLPKPSFVKPCQPTLLEHDEVVDAFGTLHPATVDDIAWALARILGVRQACILRTRDPPADEDDDASSTIRPGETPETRVRSRGVGEHVDRRCGGDLVRPTSCSRSSRHTASLGIGGWGNDGVTSA